MKQRKCGFCKQKFYKLAQCYVSKIGTPYLDKTIKTIVGFSTVYLCDDCKNLEYERLGTKEHPFILEEDYFKK